MLSVAEVGEEQLAAGKSDEDQGDFISVRGRRAQNPMGCMPLCSSWG